MTALINAHNPGGKPEPPHVGVTANVFPEAQSSHTGVSSDYMPKPNHQWYVLRTRYGRELKTKEMLQEAGVATFVAMKYAKKKVNGKIRRIRVPMIPNLIFVYSTWENLSAVVRRPSPISEYARLYLNKANSPDSSGLNPPVVIEYQKMMNFIKGASIDSKHTMMVDAEQCHFRSGEKVRVVGGEFKGIVGRVARVSGQQRVIIEIDNIGWMATAYIPSVFLEVIQNESYMQDS